jgi:hypothetical protein
MKARSVAHFDFGSRLGEISHILPLAAGRAVVVSRYRRCLVVVDGAATTEIDLAPLARTPRAEKADLAWRGAPFRWGKGFGIVYSDVLHLWPDHDRPPVTRPVTIADADLRRERGCLEPILACSVSDRAAEVALHAGAASVHAAHRIVRVEWDDEGARFTAGDRYLDLRSVVGLESSPDPVTAPHPPAIQAIRSADEGVWAHTTGRSTNHARYGMEVSGLALLAGVGRVDRFIRVDDGYGSFGADNITLQRLRSKGGGIDLATFDFEGRPRGDVRITKKAMAPLENRWLVFAPGPGELWLGDGEGRVARFEVA